MIYLLKIPATILLRKRLPQTREDWMLFAAITILMIIYYSIRKKWFTGPLRWIIGGVLFIAGIGGLFFYSNYWTRIFLWCLTCSLIYYLLYELLKWITIRNRPIDINGNGSSDGSKKISEEEELEMNKIAIIALVIWMIIGFFITR